MTFWLSKASLLWKSPGFCEQDRDPAPSSCLLPLLWLMSTAQVTGNWVLIDDNNRFATLVADVRKTASYLTDVSPCIAKENPQITLPLWYGDRRNPCTQKVGEGRPRLTRALPWLRGTDSSPQTAELPQVKITILALSNSEGNVETVATTQSPIARARQNAWSESYQNQKSGLLQANLCSLLLYVKINVNTHILHPAENVKLHWPRRWPSAPSVTQITSRGLEQAEIAFSVGYLAHCKLTDNVCLHVLLDSLLGQI